MSPEQKIRKSKKARNRRNRRPSKKPRSQKVKKPLLTPGICFLALFILMNIGAFFIYLGHDEFQSLPDEVSKASILTPLLATFFTLSGSLAFFGYHHLNDGNHWTKVHKTLLGISFAAICFLFAMSFKQDIALNGDNAEYMISAQSLVERGGVYRLYTPGETPNTLASIGLPLLLTPIYALWGFDIFKMKVLILLFGISIFPLTYRLFKLHHNRNYSALLAITVASSPYLVANATSVMTEAPYVCWSLLALITSYHYLSSKKFHWGYFIATVALIAMAYITRAVGIAILVSLLAILFLQTPWKSILKHGLGKEGQSLRLVKFLAVFVPLVLGFLILQFSLAKEGVSQLDVFLGKDLFTYLNVNIRAAYHVVGHMLFNNETYRWYQMLPGLGLDPPNLGYLVSQLVLLGGLIYAVIKKDLKAFYALVATLLILLASLTPQEMVIIRYLSVLVPFIIYYFAYGVDLASSTVFKRLHMKVKWARILPALALGIIFLTGMTGNITNISKSKIGSGPHAESYIYAAYWCGQNLPPDSYVMSFKPRITYLYSGLKGKSIASTQDRYSQEYEKEKLEEIRKEGITHLIIDGLSGRTQEVIFPIVQNNPHLFEAYEIPELQRRCTVIRFMDSEEGALE